MRRSRLSALLFVTIAALPAVGFGLRSLASPTTDPAVDRARDEVKMLDDLYKTAVVLITDHYVNDVSDTAAGQVARELFEAMQKNGWHEAHLVDATGKPISKDNAPRDAFERKAIEKIRGGEKYYEEVVQENGGRTLRAATIVPVVMKKCIICHPGYKEGDLLGAISYKLPIK